MHSLASIPTDDLIAELEHRRRKISDCLESREDKDLERVVHAVCQSWGIATHSLFDQSRSNVICQPRQAAMFILRKSYSWTFQAIGHAFGLNHGTVIHAVTTHQARTASVTGYKSRSLGGMAATPEQP